jgi:hypothetical protein
MLSATMLLSEKEVREFQAIALEEYGLELSDDEARVRATEFALLGELIYKKLPLEKAIWPHPSDDPAAATL